MTQTFFGGAWFGGSVAGLLAAMLSTPAWSDSSSPELASYYDRHMAVVNGAAYGWVGRGSPQRLRAGALQVGVSKDAYFTLLSDGTLLAWSGAPVTARTLMTGVVRFAAGQSGWFAIDHSHALWHAAGPGAAPQLWASDVLTASIGDGADYVVTRDGRLLVRGLAHRGQYGDGRLTESKTLVTTADSVVDVKAHTGHAIHLRRDGVVMGTGGNRFGPLSSHGLGDKADRWGRLFDGAVAIATGSRHSAAIRADGSLWVWGEGFAIAPTRLHEQVTAVAAGDTATIARTADGTLWQWDKGGVARRLVLKED